MKNSRIGSSTVSVGDYTYGDAGLKIKEWGEGASLTIGKYCSLGENITVYLGGNHRTDWITTYPFGHTNQNIFGSTKITGHPSSKGPVTIGNDVWIGADAKILSGVNIGNGAVIAGSSVIAKDVPPYAIVAGNPGVVVKYRFSKSIIDLLEKLAWWDLTAQQVNNIKIVLCAAPNIEILNQLISFYRNE